MSATLMLLPMLLLVATVVLAIYPPRVDYSALPSPDANVARDAKLYIEAARLLCKVPPMSWIRDCSDDTAIAEMLIEQSGGDDVSVWKQFALYYYAATRDVAQTAIAVRFLESNIKHWALADTDHHSLNMEIYERILHSPRFCHFGYVQPAFVTE